MLLSWLNVEAIPAKRPHRTPLPGWNALAAVVARLQDTNRHMAIPLPLRLVTAEPSLSWCRLRPTACVQDCPLYRVLPRAQ